MRIHTLLFFVSVLFVFQSCIKEPEEIVPLPNCPEVWDLGEFLMEPESLDCMPYELSMQSVILSDSLGNEFTALVTQSDFGLNTLTNLTEEPCPDDSLQTVQFSQSVESRSFTLEIAELDMRILLSLRANVIRTEILTFIDTTGFDPLLFTDALNFTIIHPASTFIVNSQMSATFDIRNHPFAVLSVPQSEVEISGETFSDVYVGSFELPSQPNDFVLYYTKEHGIAGIVKKDGTLSLKFERTE